jgi:Mg-chelatase subunit ChlD
MQVQAQQAPVVTAFMDERNHLRVSLASADIQTCPPADIIAVVDISGSMGATAAGKTDGSTQYVDLGFSLLDLIKHAMKAIIRTLRDEDRLALIVYDDVADVLFPPLPMNKEMQQMVESALETLEGRNSTDIYNALKEAIAMVMSRDDKSRAP